MMQTLERINEHFVAACMSIPACKELDSVSIIVNGCICAVADAVMRRRANDHPSEACSHLMGMSRAFAFGGMGDGWSTQQTVFHCQYFAIGIFLCYWQVNAVMGVSWGCQALASVSAASQRRLRQLSFINRSCAWHAQPFWTISPRRVSSSYKRYNCGCAALQMLLCGPCLPRRRVNPFQKLSRYSHGKMSRNCSPRSPL